MKKVLVVDDDPEIIELVQNRLKANNYEVISAANGKEGLKKAQQQKPDLIIMDIMMPNLPGGDAVRLLKSDVATKHIPVIFLTAMTADIPQGAGAKSINVDGQFYNAVAKPFEPANLLFEVKKMLGDK